MKPPVEPARLRARFPSLTDDDLAAYAEVSARILADPRQAGRVLAETMALSERASAKEAAGAALEAEERTALAYVRALGKMQG